MSAIKGISNPQALGNYLVPATGNIAGVLQTLTAGVTPFEVDFSEYALNGVPFIPQSAYVDNSGGTSALIITSQKLNGFTLGIINAGSVESINFPSLGDDHYYITGNGNVQIVWSNAPALSNNPDSVLVSSSAPINTLITTQPGGQNNLSVLAGTTTNSVGTGTLIALVGFSFSVSQNATLAVAGTTLLSISIDGYYVYEENLYFGTTMSSSSQPMGRTIMFPHTSYPCAGGNLTATVSTALNAGIIDVNGYFI